MRQQFGFFQGTVSCGLDLNRVIKFIWYLYKRCCISHLGSTRSSTSISECLPHPRHYSRLLGFSCELNRQKPLPSNTVHFLFCFVLNTHMLTVLFLRTSMLRCSLRHQSHLKTHHRVLSKSILSKEYKNQIILDVPVGWKGKEGRTFVLPGGGTMKRLKAWALESNCLGSNIWGSTYQLCHLGQLT